MRDKPTTYPIGDEPCQICRGQAERRIVEWLRDPQRPCEEPGSAFHQVEVAVLANLADEIEQGDHRA